MLALAAHALAEVIEYQIFLNGGLFISNVYISFPLVPIISFALFHVGTEQT